MTDPTEKEALQNILEPIAYALKDVALDDTKGAAAELQAKLPFEGQVVRSVRQAAIAALAAGWLCPKENQGIHFGRVAKDLQGFSVDAVRMDRAGPQHRHPNGEIDLCFALDGDPQFDGHPEGWVVYSPSSEHVPTVAGGTMLILYFLPGGAIEFA